MVSHLGVVEWSSADGGRITLCLPGAKLSAVPALPASGVIFLLVALASVSFDGLSKTFFWLGSNGLNPLEYPGRTALMDINGVGLLATCAALVAAFLLCIFARRAAGPQPATASGKRRERWYGRSCRSRSPTTSRII